MTTVGHAYNAAGWVTQVAHRKSDASVLETFDYTYDAVGNPTQLAEASGDVTTWTYDALNQLTDDVRAGGTSYNATFSYDAVGNRTLYHGTQTYTYDAADQLTLHDNAGALTTFTYDANGNLVAQQEAAGITTLTWGHENELLTVFEPDGTLVTMTYDGDLKRRKRAEGSGWTTYLWDREQVLMELNKTGTTTVRYTQAPRGYGDVVSQRRSSASTFWHFDAIGSMRFLTAADQSKAINYVYDAFGITRSVSGTTTNRFRYIGKLGYYLEPALGCYYLRRRYYVHWLGRFLSKDPLRQGGENAYVYVRNGPGRRTDASGKLGPRRHVGALLPQANCLGSAPPAGGGTSCDPYTGAIRMRVDSTTDPCLAGCVSRHESRHVAQVGECCRRAGMCHQYWAHRNEDMSERCEEAWNAWWQAVTPAAECVAHAEMELCLEAQLGNLQSVAGGGLTLTGDGEGIGIGLPPGSSTDDPLLPIWAKRCCQVIRGYLPTVRALTRGWCARAPRGMPPCPFDQTGFPSTDPPATGGPGCIVVGPGHVVCPPPGGGYWPD